MRLARFLPARLRRLAPEAMKFALVGGVNTLINFLVLNALILTVLNNGELKAKIIATVVATITSYLMNRHWTYNDRPKSAMHREFTLFVFFNAAGLAIELAILGLTKYWFGLNSLVAINIAALVGLALGTLFRFFTYRTFVFAQAPQEVAAVGPDGADIDLGPLHLHVDNLDEMLDAEAAASTLAGVPISAHRSPDEIDIHPDTDLPDLNTELDVALAADLDQALEAELAAKPRNL